MHSGEGIQGCTIYTGTAGVAYMFLRLAESLDHIQHKMADHPKEPFAKLHSVGLLNRADEYGHWAKHLSHGGHQKVPPCLAHLSFTTETSLHCTDAKGWSSGTHIILHAGPAGGENDAVLAAAHFACPLHDMSISSKLSLVWRLQRVTFLEGHPGCLAVQTAIASLRGNKVQAAHCIQVALAVGRSDLPVHTEPGCIHRCCSSCRHHCSMHAYAQCVNAL